MYSISLKDSTDLIEVIKIGIYDFLSLVIKMYGTSSIFLLSAGKNFVSISRVFFCGGFTGLGAGDGLVAVMGVDFMDRLLAVFTLFTDVVEGECISSTLPGVNVVILELLDGATGVGIVDAE